MIAQPHYLKGLEAESPDSFVDRDIPALQVLLNPRELGQHLSGVLSRECGVVRDVKLVVLQRHRRKRWTVNLALETTTGKYELIGKLYATDREDVFRAMKQISEAGFGPEAEFSIPKPLAYIQDLKLLLQEKVEGRLATEIFSNGNESQRALAAERCARWLAHFHANAPPVGNAFLLTNELMDYWVHRFRSVGSLEMKARLLSQRLATAALALGPTETCACHGGYWHQQIILTDDRVATVDWDNHCIADPARDVAKFIIELQQLALRSHGRTDALDVVIEVFYQTYTANSRFPVAKSLPLYKAAVCLKRSKYHLRPGGSGVEQAEAMLDEGLRVLTEEGST